MSHFNRFFFILNGVCSAMLWVLYGTELFTGYFFIALLVERLFFVITGGMFWELLPRLWISETKLMETLGLLFIFWLICCFWRWECLLIGLKLLFWLNYFKTGLSLIGVEVLINGETGALTWCLGLDICNCLIIVSLLWWLTFSFSMNLKIFLRVYGWKLVKEAILALR